MGTFLITSLVASIVLTVLLNVVPRVFPGASRRAEEKFHDYVLENEQARSQRLDPNDNGPRVKVSAPWKAMIVGSIVLTILVNLVPLVLNAF